MGECCTRRALARCFTDRGPDRSNNSSLCMKRCSIIPVRDIRKQAYREKAFTTHHEPPITMMRLIFNQPLRRRCRCRRGAWAPQAIIRITPPPLRLSISLPISRGDRHHRHPIRVYMHIHCLPSHTRISLSGFSLLYLFSPSLRPLSSPLPPFIPSQTRERKRGNKKEAGEYIYYHAEGALIYPTGSSFQRCKVIFDLCRG